MKLYISQEDKSITRSLDKNKQIALDKSANLFTKKDKFKDAKSLKDSFNYRPPYAHKFLNHMHITMI